MLLSLDIKNFLKFLEDNQQSAHTIKNYNHYLDRFVEFTKDIETSGVTQILINKYIKFLSEIETENGSLLKNPTQNYHLIALRAFLQYKSQDIPTLSLLKVDLSKQEKNQVNLLTLDQVRKVIEAPDLTKKDGIRDRAILETISCTGFLVSDLVALNVLNVDINLGHIKFSEKIYPLSLQAQKALETYLLDRKDTYPPLFIRYHKQGGIEEGEVLRLSTRAIERITAKYGKLAGVSKVTPLVLRLSLASNLLDNGEDLKAVSEIMGHKNLSTTKIYAGQLI